MIDRGGIDLDLDLQPLVLRHDLHQRLAGGDHAAEGADLHLVHDAGDGGAHLQPVHLSLAGGDLERQLLDRGGDLAQLVRDLLAAAALGLLHLERGIALGGLQLGNPGHQRRALAGQVGAAAAQLDQLAAARQPLVEKALLRRDLRIDQGDLRPQGLDLRLGPLDLPGDPVLRLDQALAPAGLRLGAGLEDRALRRLLGLPLERLAGQRLGRGDGREIHRLEAGLLGQQPGVQGQRGGDPGARALEVEGDQVGADEVESVGGLPYVDWNTPSPGLFVAKDPGSLLYQPDVPKDLADWALSQLQPQSMAANMGIVPPQAWQDDWYQGRLGYIKATEDVVNPIADQENMIAQSGGNDKWITRLLDGSGHSPMLSRPAELARVVDSLIQEFQRNTI